MAAAAAALAPGAGHAVGAVVGSVGGVVAGPGRKHEIVAEPELALVAADIVEWAVAEVGNIAD